MYDGGREGRESRVKTGGEKYEREAIVTKSPGGAKVPVRGRPGDLMFRGAQKEKRDMARGRNEEMGQFGQLCKERSQTEKGGTSRTIKLTDAREKKLIDCARLGEREGRKIRYVVS